MDKAEINKSYHTILKVDEIDDLHKVREKFALNEKINIFNHYINQIILQLCKIKLELKNTYTE